ncbi:MAG: DNA polymerase III subunit beta [Candidatus Paceibacterota bacterium]
MKIKCVLEKLKAAVSKTERITTKKASLPVLECLLLEVVDNMLYVRATNLDIGVEIKIPVKMDEPGRVAVPASVFSQYLSHLPSDGSVELKHNGKTLRVSGSTSNTEIKTREDDEFPSIPKVESGTKTELSTEKITTGFKSVWYAASPSSMKPELSSVYMFSEDGDLFFVATDSFRLAEKVIKDTSVGDISVLIPHQNVAEIIRVISDLDTDATITVGENQVTLMAGDTYISSRLIDGSFPDYKKIIPDSSDVSINVSVNELSNSLRISDIFSDKFNQLTITVNPDNKTLQLTSSNTDIGENTTSIPVDVKGVDLSVQFNHRYITDVFGSISTPEVQLNLSQDAPMVIKPKGDESFQYLVMPMSN